MYQISDHNLFLKLRTFIPDLSAKNIFMINLKTISSIPLPGLSIGHFNRRCRTFPGGMRGTFILSQEVKFVKTRKQIALGVHHVHFVRYVHLKGTKRTGDTRGRFTVSQRRQVWQKMQKNALGVRNVVFVR